MREKRDIHGEKVMFLHSFNDFENISELYDFLKTVIFSNFSINLISKTFRQTFRKCISWFNLLIVQNLEI